MHLIKINTQDNERGISHLVLPLALLLLVGIGAIGYKVYGNSGSQGVTQGLIQADSQQSAALTKLEYKYDTSYSLPSACNTSPKFAAVQRQLQYEAEQTHKLLKKAKKDPYKSMTKNFNKFLASREAVQNKAKKKNIKWTNDKKYGDLQFSLDETADTWREQLRIDATEYRDYIEAKKIILVALCEDNLDAEWKKTERQALYLETSVLKVNDNKYRLNEYSKSAKNKLNSLKKYVNKAKGPANDYTAPEPGTVYGSS
jgi:hypothetical protein